MDADKFESYESYLRRRETAMRTCYDKVQDLLEKSYKLSPNVVEKMLDTFFSPDFLPNWYFHSNSTDEISHHVYIITQLLNARTDHLRQVSDDGRAITYFVNVGRDFPGKLLTLILENEGMGIIALDAARTRSGIWIVTMERADRRALEASSEERVEIAELLDKVRCHGASVGHSHTEAFIRALPANYTSEEINSLTYPRRILRHEDLFEEAYEGQFLAVRVGDTQWEIDDSNEKLESTELRCAVAVRHPGQDFISSILTLFRDAGISISRAYYDTMAGNGVDPEVGILSVYVRSDQDLDSIKAHLVGIRMHDETQAETREPSGSIGRDMERIVRTLSDATAGIQGKEKALRDLKILAAQNSDLSSSEEIGNFLLNAISDFFEGARLNGLYESDEILTLLLAYDAFDEFWIESRKDGAAANREGFRVKHNSARGPAKGGIRNDMIVRFDEVAALSFMMSWKCARSKILFGGAKGGLKINPKDYAGIDFFDTLTNFGRSLFLVTGPARDVPAGDVGCGAVEIGHMFEGFKSALRDLAAMTYGLKQGVAFVGDKIVSIEQAREILKVSFNIDHHDHAVLRELTENEEYLELVAAAQITGKPKMGIEARTGATGRGLCFSILATVCNLYLDSRWESTTPLTADDVDVVRQVTSIDESSVIAARGFNIISEDTWSRLDSVILPALLSGKRVVVQGFGKVGISLLRELGRYGIAIAAVSDSRGAVAGSNLSFDDLVAAKRETGSVIGLNGGGTRVMPGTEAGAQVLEIPCDILVTAALENCVSAANAARINTKLEACGSNGPNTSKGEQILAKRGVTVIYDFLANGGGVTASYLEWLRNLAERFRYESEKIRGVPFSVDLMDPYLMPEYRERIKTVLSRPESDESTTEWNLLLRDIMFAAVNEDYRRSAETNIPMKTAGFANAQLRVLAATLARSPDDERRRIWEALPERGRRAIQPFLSHPEVDLFGHIDRSEYKVGG